MVKWKHFVICYCQHLKFFLYKTLPTLPLLVKDALYKVSDELSVWKSIPNSFFLNKLLVYIWLNLNKNFDMNILK